MRHRFIGLFRGKRQLAAIIRVNKDGSLFYNFMNANDKRLNAFRVGVLLRSKTEKGE